MCQNPAFTGLKKHARPLDSDVFSVIGTHVSGAEFQYPDLTWKELCGMMANLIAESGVIRSQ